MAQQTNTTSTSSAADSLPAPTRATFRPRPPRPNTTPPPPAADSLPAPTRASLLARPADARRRGNGGALGSPEGAQAWADGGRIGVEIARMERARDPPRV